MNKPKTKTPDKRTGPGKGPLLLAVVLALLFWRSFLPDYVHFSNDGPLGQQATACATFPGNFGGAWGDTNELGSSGGAWPLNLSILLRWFLGPVGYSKFYVPCALFVLGLGCWTFFRSLKLSPLAVVSGMLGVTLSTGFFAGACWGVASAEIAIGFNFFALALVVANEGEILAWKRWTRLALAGFCVGVNVMEAADIGVLCSVFVAGYIFLKAVFEANGRLLANALRGVAQVAVVAVFAGFISLSTVISLVGTPGIVTNEKSTETPEQHWDWATQWSLPKIETFGIFVPGVFGYRMDTPNNMEPKFRDDYNGGVYWGGMGRDPNIDRYFDSGGQNPPGGLMRFGYAGYYCGLMVVLMAIWTVAQSFRREKSPFTLTQKKFIWFWAVVVAGSLLLAWGRFAPLFYGLFYKIPHFSAMRNPTKFLIFTMWALAVLFSYGVHALSLRYLEPKTGKDPQPPVKWDAFDRRWLFLCLGLLAASIIGWLIYSNQQENLVHYLQKVGYGDENFAHAIAAFSLGQAGWFVGLLTAAVALIAAIMSGFFSGSRAKIGAGLFIGFLLFDLGRANLPFIIHWDYKQKYEVGSLNPIEDMLRDKPYEHRVAKLLPPPLSTPSQFQLFDQLYGIEWTQHHFLYYNIQCLDVIQMPRVQADLAAYQAAFRIGIKQDAAGQYGFDQATFPKLTRRWELSNTRYLLGPAALLDSFNSEFDPGRGRFRIAKRFSIGLKPGVTEFHQRLEELTAYPNDNGDYALFDFTGALPRVKLYANWQVNTNLETTLTTLADLNFDPAKTVLVATPLPNLPAVSTNENVGTVDFKEYSSKHIVFSANAPTATVLLLNDLYDPNWRVTVDGQPAPLLRCNYMVRGVYLQPGAHVVQFDFSLPNKPLYVTLSAIIVAALLGGCLLLANRKKAGSAP
ncbi:MAG: hypothetical protein P4N60_14000 [Verrucomicrobiae bacterium]|nr:hypothetical protein [Verrucomicrobiae bacterium]